MANIDIQPRQRTTWPWILAAVGVLALLLWWIFGMRNSDPNPVVAEADSVITDAGSVGLPTAVDAYVRFVDSTRAGTAMGVDHEFTATGIRNLAAALEAVAQRGGADVQRELTTLRQQADTLQRDPRSTEHAGHTRTAFVTLAGVMAAIQQARFPDMEADIGNVKAAAERLDASRPLLQQREAVQSFFDRTATAVRRMSNGRT